NVWSFDGCHLSPLHVAGAPLREQDDYVGVSAVLDAVDCRRPGVAGGGRDDVDTTALPRQHMFEQPADQLQGKVLERQRRAVEQLLEEVAVVNLHKWNDGGMIEGGVGVAAHGREQARL